MNMLLIANNFTSAAVIIACWWLAHQYSRTSPPGRLISVGLSLLGFNTLFILVGRNVGMPIAWPAVGSKFLLSAILILIVIRRITKGQK
ncbi:hypothetical protein GGR95_002972 [Sulfitobacter undariae]|uniref:Sugar efflux transporter for intercellular exchange n=1 Tax=Sulfitobacter undariae TaxID=1563671 RepID=A0A7W6E5U5_9RHOB|nr:hypothetical protein [Sulfitobacter undariae]MBB3995317.1 hypothetical protein [Sulfitobacter undariae]